jgi:phosphoketolase
MKTLNQDLKNLHDYLPHNTNVDKEMKGELTKMVQTLSSVAQSNGKDIPEIKALLKNS